MSTSGPAICFLSLVTFPTQPPLMSVIIPGLGILPSGFVVVVPVANSYLPISFIAIATSRLQDRPRGWDQTALLKYELSLSVAPDIRFSGT